jgi:hypothetical protein
VFKIAFQPLICPVRFSRFGRRAMAVRYSTFIAACSLGKWPLARTARRMRAFRLSIALVSGMTGGDAFVGLLQGLASLDRASGCSGGIVRAGRCYSMSCELVLVLGRPNDWPDCAASANPFLSFQPDGSSISLA